MTRLINPDQQYFDNDTGAPLALGTVYFGEPNQDPETNPKAVYADADLVTPLSPTQALTAAGKHQQAIYLDGEYSITVRDSGGSLISAEENFAGAEIGGGPQSLRFQLASTSGAGMVGLGQSGTLADAIGATIYAQAYGVTGDGSDQTAAVNAAIAAAGVNGHIVWPKGAIKYTGSIQPLQGQKWSGAGNNGTNFEVYPATGEYAIDLTGVSLTVARDFRVITSENGINFACTSTASCLLNNWENVEVIGDNIGHGRGATPTENTNVGIRFGPMNGTRAAFFNTVRRPYIRGFNTNVLFDAAAGAPTLGGNANHVLDAHHQTYWYANRYRSIENEVRGGFYNQSSGTATHRTVMHKLENGATRNEIDGAIGEPGAYTMAFDIEEGCDNNYIPQKSYNVSHGSVDRGHNNGLSNGLDMTVSRYYSGLPENTYQRIKLFSATVDGTGYTGLVRYEGRNTGLKNTSCGTFEFYASRNSAGAITTQAKTVSDRRAGVGGVPVMVGLEVGGSDVYAVFQITNNGTASTALLRVAFTLIGDANNRLGSTFEATTAPAKTHGLKDAVETVGRVVMTDLPTSAAGLPSGALWNNAGVLNIVP